MKAIIITDDSLSLKKVINSIDAINNVELVKTFTGIKNVEEYVSINEVDVAFVDIESLKNKKLELINNIKKINKAIFVVLISDSKEDSFAAYSLHSVGFLLKPLNNELIINEIDHIKTIAPHLNKRVEIRTFGNFSVLVNGKAIHFPIKKTKEILAYLVNKQGTQVDWPTLAAEVLDENLYDKVIQNRLHRYVECLKTTLKENNLENILVSSKGYLSVNTNAFDCDLYELINGSEKAKNYYFGEYMYEYPWADSRTAYIDRIVNLKKE